MSLRQVATSLEAGAASKTMFQKWFWQILLLCIVPQFGWAAPTLSFSSVVSPNTDSFALWLAFGIFIITSLIDRVTYRDHPPFNSIQLMLVALPWAMLRMGLPASNEVLPFYFSLTAVQNVSLCLFARRLLDLPTLQQGLSRLFVLISGAILVVGGVCLLLPSAWAAWLLVIESVGLLLFIIWSGSKIGRWLEPPLLAFYASFFLLVALQVSGAITISERMALPGPLGIDLLVIMVLFAWRFAIEFYKRQLQEEGLLAKDQLIAEQNDQLDFLHSAENVLSQRLEKRDLKIHSLKNQLTDGLKRQHYLEKQLIQSEELIRQFSYYDSLTSLPNRALFSNRLEQLIEQAEAYQPKRGLLLGMLDIDRFGVVNAERGPEVGDQLLNAVAKRLQMILPIDSLIARLGGDEFGFVLVDVSGGEVLGVLIQRWMQELASPFDITASDQISLSFSFAVVGFPEQGSTASQLLQQVESKVTTVKESVRSAAVKSLVAG